MLKYEHVPSVFGGPSEEVITAPEPDPNNRVPSVQPPISTGNVAWNLAAGSAQTGTPVQVSGRGRIGARNPSASLSAVWSCRLNLQPIHRDAAPGLLQGNARPPADTPFGSRVPLLLNIRDAVSQSGVHMAVP